MLGECHNCLFMSKGLGCIWGDDPEASGCGYWIPDDEAMEQMKKDRKNWMKIYARERMRIAELRKKEE